MAPAADAGWLQLLSWSAAAPSHTGIRARIRSHPAFVVGSSASQFTALNSALRVRNASAVLIGGSASAGAKLPPGARGYPTLAIDGVNQALRKAGQLQLTNHAQGSTRTWWALMLLEALVDRGVDLLIWEYAMNDTYFCNRAGNNVAARTQLACTLQALLLRLSRLPRPPVVVLLFLWPCNRNDAAVFSRTFFADLRPWLVSYARRHPLLALDASAWMHSAPGARLAPRDPSFVHTMKVEGDRCHPSAKAHELIGQLLSRGLLRKLGLGLQPGELGSSEAAGRGPMSAARAGGRPLQPSATCAALWARNASTAGAAARLRLRNDAATYLAWEPRLKAEASRPLAGVLQPQRPAQTRQLAGFQCLPTRGDCKRSAILPRCGAGDANLSFSLRQLAGGRVPLIAGASWKLDAPQVQLWGRERVGDGSFRWRELRAEQSQMNLRCARTLDSFIGKAFPALVYDSWWLPPEPVALESLHLCADAGRSTSSLHWLTVFYAGGQGREVHDP